jgi:hypothetical protein
MSGIEGVGGRVRFTSDEDEATRNIVERDTKVGISGNDKTWSQTKAEHQTHVGIWEGAHVAVDTFEAAKAAEAIHIEGRLLATCAGAGAPVAALAIGVHEFIEMHDKRDAQKAALQKDNAHVALVGTLDLPGCYKTKRFEKDFAHVSREANSEAFKMTEKVAADPKGCALLQLHADRGMHAAKDLMLSKASVESFLKSNPKVAEQYQKDAAFREGFDAYLFTKANGSAQDIGTMEAGLVKRDGWYGADHVSIRV